MNAKDLAVAYLTAGGAGMYCGSCLRDNTLAAALVRLGCDVTLIPTYTPIRTDEEDVSVPHVFFGGINVFLQQKLVLARHLPRFLDRWLDQPWLINWFASRALQTDARQLGALTVSMLGGESGNQRKEVRRLVSWLERRVRPSLVNLSNILIAGCVPAIKRRLKVPVLVTLQGDDLFLEGLSEPYKSQAMSQIRQLAAQVDGFLVFSRYYADFMADYFQIPPARFHLVPLGLNLDGYRKAGPPHRPTRPPTVGYLARLCPEKGLHVLVDAFLLLGNMPGTEDARLRIAGWLAGSDRSFFDRLVRKVAAAGRAGAFEYAGVVDRNEKLNFLRGIDVLSVPTTYREPKGLFVLEALASGVPVVEPEHGAFPELLAATGGGRLVRPHDPAHLARTLHELLTDADLRLELGHAGRQQVERHFSAEKMAESTLAVYRQYL